MKQSLYKSLALHFVVFLLIMVDIPLFWHNKTTLNQVPIIVDLNNVKISEMTNLPPKAKMGKEDKAASKVKRKIENNYTKEEPKKDDKHPTAKEPEEEKNPQKAQDSMLYSPSVTTASLMQKISATAPATGVPINQLEKRLALLKY